MVDLVDADVVAQRDDALDPVAGDHAEVLHDGLLHPHPPVARHGGDDVERSRVLRAELRAWRRRGEMGTGLRGEPGGRRLQLKDEAVGEQRGDGDDDRREGDEPTGGQAHAGQRGRRRASVTGIAADAAEIRL